MINPDLDIPALRDAFRRTGRVQVRDVLSTDTARRIEHVLLNEIVWDLAMLVDGQDRLISREAWAALPDAERRQMIQQANTTGRTGFQYVSEYYSMRAAYHEGWAPATFLNDVTAFLESGGFVDFIRQITGDAALATADCQATCYRTGHYLTQHDDTQIASRRMAYVLNFTRTWRADWGGLLLFFDDAGNVAEGYLPAFNVLNLFSVPIRHAVSFVTPLAGGPRLAITGWLHEAPLGQRE